MADVINLRRERKRRARAVASAEADNNRVIHGRSKIERQTAEAERMRSERTLEGHRLDARDPGPDSLPDHEGR